MRTPPGAILKARPDSPENRGGQKTSATAAGLKVIINDARRGQAAPRHGARLGGPCRIRRPPRLAERRFSSLPNSDSGKAAEHAPSVKPGDSTHRRTPGAKAGYIVVSVLVRDVIELEFGFGVDHGHLAFGTTAPEVPVTFPRMVAAPVVWEEAESPPRSPSTNRANTRFMRSPLWG
jgi:hypothetical protein